ncbi:MFS transporter [Paenibacillus donghaensis]|uniref:MFS transporter n=1 Tax=Paenibacillus donghaensis TaxID=414771 RepID=UPI001883420E|nr:MFS transporter [Paenibacillus donghaensis]MBE9916384.1 MFS transporter [Paenibacillus donghaensis]
MGGTWNRSLRWLCMDQMRSALAGTAGTFILSWMLYELTGSKTAMGGLWLLSLSGQWLVQWIVGPFIDRWKRITVMKLSETIRGAAYLFVWLMWIVGVREAYILLIASFVSSIQIYDAAAGALIPKLAASDSLVRVNAVISGSIQLMRVLALPAAGMIASAFSSEILLPVMTLLFLSAWISAVYIQERPQPSRECRTWKGSFKQGLYVYKSNTILCGLALLISVTSFGVFATQAMYIPYVTETLNGGPLDYGLFSAAFPLGYVCGSIIVGRLREPGTHLYTVMSAALFAGGMTYILLGMTTNIKVALAIEMTAGVAMPFWNVYSSTLYYRIVPEAILGQVLSVRSLLTRAMTPIGVMYGTFCASAFGLPELFLSVGVLICLTSSTGILVAGRSATKQRASTVPAKE